MAQITRELARSASLFTLIFPEEIFGSLFHDLALLESECKRYKVPGKCCIDFPSFFLSSILLRAG